MKTVGKLVKPDAPEEPKGEVAPPKRKGAGPSQATGN